MKLYSPCGLLLIIATGSDPIVYTFTLIIPLIVDAVLSILHSCLIPFTIQSGSEGSLMNCTSRLYTFFFIQVKG